jgi:hypothetical protein
MIAMRQLKIRILGAVLVGVLCAWCGVGSASAASPWWHFSTSSRPSYLQSGQAKDEVQQLTVSGTEGEFVIEYPHLSTLPNKALIFVGEDPALVQARFERIFGAGNVEVVGGPGKGENLYEEYKIKFVGKLADQPVGVPIVTRAELVGGRARVEVGEVAQGRPDGLIVLTAVNLGDATVDAEAAPVTVTDILPAGLEAVGIEGTTAERELASRSHSPLDCTLASLSCTYTGAGDTLKGLPPYEQLQVRIAVRVTGAKTGEVNEARITGGGVPSAMATQALTVSNAPIPFGVNTYEVRLEEPGGSVDTQAGSHPFQVTTTLAFNEAPSISTEGRFEAKPAGALSKDLHFDLPPGAIGNPTAFPQCTLAQFLNHNHNDKSAGEGSENGDKCSPRTAIGVVRVLVAIDGIFGGKVGTFTVPLFNIEPAVGEPARFGFIVEGEPVLLDTAVRTGGDYGVTVSVSNITQTVGFLASEVTIWGVPGDPRHDNQRGWDCLAVANGVAEGKESQLGLDGVSCPPFEDRNPPPLLVLPTSCNGPLQTTVEADSWLEPHNIQSVANTAPISGMDGCNRLQFNPSISVAPDSQAGSTPTGLAVTVRVPQTASLDPEGLADAYVKNTTVALPTGVAINPSGADGLQACSEEEIALKSAEPPTCPEASKIGLVKVKTPLLPNPLEGAAYLAAQNANPFGSLLAVYVYVEDPISGSRVKVAGEVVPNPITGQLVSTFKDTPQLPFETFEIHFFGGDRAPLASPARCGAYTTTASIEPWTENGAVGSSSTFDIASGPATFNEPQGRPCPGVRLPFEPSLTGGATNINAGAFSPLTLTFSRKDGEQNMQSAEAKLPPGLSGILSNIELCPEPQANLGECPANSLVGETTVSVGVGGDPFSVGGGRFYLTGPYNGTGACTMGSPGCAPFGLTFEVPAKAGPFDLKRNTQNPAGEDPCDCVIVRGKIEVNPITAAITIRSDPPGSPYAIPTSIEGIPLEIQHINATTTRNDFQFNPTNCEKMQATGTINSSEGATDAVSVPFQVTNCAILGFKPSFKVSVSGKTSRADGASLNVKLTYPKAPFGSQANIKSVKVDLPKQLPSRLTTLQKACTAKQFEADPAGCPPESIVGHATASTPVIPVPLTGPAYFVSYGGAKFPELVIVLQGYGVTLDLHGETFISKAGITSSTFHTVPDAPVGSFELNLPQGKYSALAANGNLCKSKLAMPTLFDAQNGMVIKQSTPITVTGCPKKAVKAKKSGKRHRSKSSGKKK